MVYVMLKHRIARKRIPCTKGKLSVLAAEAL